MNGKAAAIGLVALLVAVAPAALVLAVMPPRAAAPTAAPSTSGSFEAEPTCAEWSDGCIVCQRQPSGPPACSTPGIACSRGAVRCLRRDGT